MTTKTLTQELPGNEGRPRGTCANKKPELAKKSRFEGEIVKNPKSAPTMNESFSSEFERKGKKTIQTDEE